MAAPKYIRNSAGTLTETAASETSAAEVIVATGAGGKLDISFMPAGIGPDTASIVASEILAAGALVNVWNNGGTPNVRNADASTTGKEAHGFVLSGVANGASATVYFGGENTSVTGLTAGNLYLSDTTPGGVAAAAPTTAGHIVQRVGLSYSATAMQFDPVQPITLA